MSGDIDTCQSSSWRRVKLGDKPLEVALRVAKGTSYLKISTCLEKSGESTPKAQIED